MPNEHGGRENLEAIGFLQHVNHHVLTHHPGTVMIAEESTSWPKVSRPPGDGGLGRAIALRAGGRGNVTTSARLWILERTAPDSSTPVCYDGRAYLVRGNGITLCLDLITGRKLWEERLAQGQYFSATVAGDGKVYVLGTSGTCTVLQSGAKFAKLAENKLPGTFYATPAISDGTIYLRSENVLYAVGK